MKRKIFISLLLFSSSVFTSELFLECTSTGGEIVGLKYELFIDRDNTKAHVTRFGKGTGGGLVLDYELKVTSNEYILIHSLFTINLNRKNLEYVDTTMGMIYSSGKCKIKQEEENLI
jgi:hypothetical protein